MRILVHEIPGEPPTPAWPVEVADSTLHTMHNLQLVDIDGDGRDEIVVAAWEGVFVLDRDPSGRWTKIKIGSGNQEAKPFKGASEVKVGRLLDGSHLSRRSSPGTAFRWSCMPLRLQTKRSPRKRPPRRNHLGSPRDRRASPVGSRRLVRRS